MKDCKHFEDLIKQYISGKITPDDQLKLSAHLKFCIHCKEIVEIHQMFASSAYDLPQADPVEFTHLRQNVLHSIRESRSRKTGHWYQNAMNAFTFLFKKPVATTVLAGCFFIFGFFLRGFILHSQLKGDSPLINEIKYTAEQNKNIRAVENSPFQFSQTKFQDLDDNRISLSFNVTRHVELVRPKNDPLVREVLAQTLLNPASLGNRLKAFSYAKEIIAPKIKEALIRSALNDPEMVVRMKAMNSLATYPHDKEIENAFLKILTDEESVPMRLMAIDYLANREWSQKILSEVRKELSRPNEAAMVYKINQILKK